MGAAKNFLLGKPLRTPLHPAAVHLPIALFPLSVLLDIGSWMCPWRDLYLVRGAFYCLLAGELTGLLAGLLGFVDYTEIRRDHPARATATRHMILNLAALALFGLGAALRWSALDADQTAPLPFLVSLLGLALLGYSGYLGGHLVYSDGVGVGRHRHPAPLPSETLNAPRAPGIMVPVADSSALPEGATLRADLSGTVIALARHQGKVFAFQEFCMHRFGPLSEGAVHDCQVSCPWHNSRFDLRTGEVTAGPARLAIQVFRAEDRSGEIWVETPARRAGG